MILRSTDCVVVTLVSVVQGLLVTKLRTSRHFVTYSARSYVQLCMYQSAQYVATFTKEPTSLLGGGRADGRTGGHSGSGCGPHGSSRRHGQTDNVRLRLCLLLSIEPRCVPSPRESVSVDLICQILRKFQQRKHSNND